jgi:hypothetical protein
MKHVTYADKTLFVGDEAADLLLEYAALLANKHSADTVEVNAIGSDGNAVSATFLLDAGAPLMAESTNSEMEPPDNWVAMEYMRGQMSKLRPPLPITSEPIAADDNSFAMQVGHDEFFDDFSS